jgi:hypothetical protein
MKSKEIYRKGNIRLRTVTEKDTTYLVKELYDSKNNRYFNLELIALNKEMLKAIKKEK